jgi:molybdate transport system substrate-binding protein
MRLVRFIVIVTVFTGLLASCGLSNSDSPDENKHLTIAVSANLRFAMAKLELAFEEESGIAIEFTTASSGVLTTQILEGAPFDLFLCANMEFPKKLYEQGAATAAPKVYAAGMLVMWTTCDVTIPATLQELPSSSIRSVCVANPDHAPYGMATVEALKTAGVWDSLMQTEGRIIFGESVGDVNQKTMLCAVDIGITNKSVLFSPDVDGSNWVEIDTALYHPIKQGIVITKYGAESNRTNAQRFYDFVFSEKAREILKQYGYKV